MTLNVDQAFLGISYKYPREPDESGNAKRVSDEENINQSINEILTTPLGTRFMNEEWGSNLELLQFEPNDAVLESLLITEIGDALRKFETRIQMTSIDFQDVNEAQKDCLIHYRIRASNEIASFVFPFYKEINQ